MGIGIETTLKIMDKFGGWNDRPSSHCKAYLIQLCGMNLGYRFQWIGIPLSEGFSEDFRTYSENLEDYSARTREMEFTERTKRNLIRANGLMFYAGNVSNEEWAEMLATIHFYKNSVFVPDERDKTLDGAFKRIEEGRKKIHLDPFSRKEFEISWRRLKKEKLIV